MKIDPSQRPTGVRNIKAPPRPPADGGDEFASFAAQLAARSERLHAGVDSATPAPSADPDRAASYSLFSWFTTGRAGPITASFLLLLMASVAVVAVRGLPFQASTPLPSNRIEQAKADVPSTARLEAKVLPPVSAPAATSPPVSAPPASRTASPPPVAPPAASLPAASAPSVAPSPARQELAKGTPESRPTVSEILAAAQVGPAPLTPDEVRELQGRLKATGFNPGPIDGTMGRQTRSAVRDYAEARALPNADATRELLARLKAEPPASVASPAVSAPPVSPPPVAQQVDKPAPDSAQPLTPDEIRNLQDRLKAAGFNPGPIDGTMGRQTRSAVRDYAEARALPNADVTRGMLVRLKAEAPASVASASVASASASSPPASPPPAPQQVDRPTPDSVGPLTPDEIRNLQDRLKAAGYYSGAVDGVMGRQTRSAVRDYAEAQGVPNADATRELLSR
jgi:peptidoglycan hydrolase-like protein with peptidoglycan-binding domain